MVRIRAGGFQMTKEVREQILKVRDTGLTNMFDTRNVLEIAEALDFEELAEWLPTHKKEYSSFILYGDGEE